MNINLQLKCCFGRKNQEILQFCISLSLYKYRRINMYLFEINFNIYIYFIISLCLVNMNE